jgi:hypothetical protein
MCKLVDVPKMRYTSKDGDEKGRTMSSRRNLPERRTAPTKTMKILIGPDPEGWYHTQEALECSIQQEK